MSVVTFHFVVNRKIKEAAKKLYPDQRVVVKGVTVYLMLQHDYTSIDCLPGDH